MRTTLRTRSAAIAVASVLALGGLAACGSDSGSSSSDTTKAPDGIAVTDVWARESAMSAGNGAVYLTITNGSGAQDELTGASVPADIAAEAQVHETVQSTDSMTDDTAEGAMGSTHATVGMVHDETTDSSGDMHSDTTTGGMMSMQEVHSVVIPAGGTVVFEPGGYHVMLMDLAAPLEAGQTFPVVLTFAEAGEITVTATVRAS